MVSILNGKTHYNCLLQMRKPSDYHPHYIWHCVRTCLIVDGDDHGECGAEGDDASDGGCPWTLTILYLHPAVYVVSCSGIEGERNIKCITLYKQLSLSLMVKAILASFWFLTNDKKILYSTPSVAVHKQCESLNGLLLQLHTDEEKYIHTYCPHHKPTTVIYKHLWLQWKCLFSPI